MLLSLSIAFRSLRRRVGTFQGHKGAVWSAKLNFDATRAATGSADFTVKVWDSVSGAEITTLEHDHIVKCVDFSHDGLRLATGGNDKKLRVFSMAALDAPPSVIPHPDRIRKLVWAANDRSILTGSDDGVLRRFDVASGRCEAETTIGTSSVLDIELTADGAAITVATGSEVLFVDAHTLAVQRRFPVPYAVETASLHPNRRHFIAGGSDVRVHQYDVETGRETSCLKGHHGTIHSVRYSPSGDTFISGADDAIIRIWKYDEGAQSSSSPGPAAAAAADVLIPAQSQSPLPVSIKTSVA